MCEFILYRPANSIGPSFNEASKRLEENKSVAIKKSMNPGGMGMILIETDHQALASVEKVLPGWLIEVNRTGHF